MEQQIKVSLAEAVRSFVPGFTDEIQLTTPAPQFGDFSSNIALILAQLLIVKST